MRYPRKPGVEPRDISSLAQQGHQLLGRLWVILQPQLPGVRPSLSVSQVDDPRKRLHAPYGARLVQVNFKNLWLSFLGYSVCGSKQETAGLGVPHFATKPYYSCLNKLTGSKAKMQAIGLSSKGCQDANTKPCMRRTQHI